MLLKKNSNFYIKNGIKTEKIKKSYLNRVFLHSKNSKTHFEFLYNLSL